MKLILINIHGTFEPGLEKNIFAYEFLLGKEKRERSEKRKKGRIISHSQTKLLSI